MATCHVCPPGDDAVADEDLVDHLRLLHPDLWGDGPQCWPDGQVVVYDMTLRPGEFEENGSAPK